MHVACVASDTVSISSFARNIMYHGNADVNARMLHANGRSRAIAAALTNS